MLLLGILLVSQSQVEAENREGAFTVSPFWGGQMSIFVGDQHLDGDYQWGIRGGYNFTPHIGAEFVYAECKTVHDPGDIRASVEEYGGDFLYYFRPEKRIVPYLVGGFGAFNVDYTQSLANRRTAYFNFGTGLDCALTKWVSFRADFRDSIVFDDGNNIFAATLGLRFQVGGR